MNYSKEVPLYYEPVDGWLFKKEVDTGWDYLVVFR